MRASSVATCMPDYWHVLAAAGAAACLQGSLYFLTYNCAIVAILPWLALLWKDLGFSGGQLGILSGLRPFISAVAGARRAASGITHLPPQLLAP